MAPPKDPPERGPAFAPRKRHKPGFVLITPDQLAIPEPPRGSPPDDTHLTRLEKLVLCGILKFNWRGDPRWPCKATDLEIANAIGFVGNAHARMTMVQIALNGRMIRGVKVPGMAHPSRAWVTTSGQGCRREIVVSRKFLEWAQLRIFEASAPREGGPDRPADSPTHSQRALVDDACINSQRALGDDGCINSQRALGELTARAVRTHSARCEFTIEEEQKEESSSTRAGEAPGDRAHQADDDDGLSVSSGREETRAAALGAAAAGPWFHGDEAGARAFIDSHARDVECTLAKEAREARVAFTPALLWAWYAQALRVAAGVTKPPQRDKLHAYALVIAGKGVRTGNLPPPEAMPGLGSADPIHPAPGSRAAAALELLKRHRGEGRDLALVGDWIEPRRRPDHAPLDPAEKAELLDLMPELVALLRAMEGGPRRG